jgi:hypothetical protein
MNPTEISIQTFKIGDIDLLDTTKINMIGFNIYEDILNPLGPYGEVIIVDQTDQAGTKKLNGKEDVKISFKSFSGDTVNLKFKAFINSDASDGSAIGYGSSHSKEYTIKFISEEALNAQGNRVSKSFDEPTSSMVQKIVKENLKSSDSIEIAESTKKLTHDFPDKHPLEAIRILNDLHVGTKSKSSLFFLFKQIDGGKTKYVFDSPDNLFKKSPVATLTQRPLGLGESQQDRQDSIQWLNIPKTFDSSVRAASKAQYPHYNYATGVPHDPNRKPIKPQVADSPVYDQGREQDKEYKIHHGHNAFNQKDKEGPNGEARANRADYIAHLAQNYATLKVPGNSKIKLGSVIDLKLSNKADDNKPDGEKQINGKALVVAIRHKVLPLGQPNRYTMILGVVKGGYKDGSGGNG